MVKKRLVDAIESADKKTNFWKTSFVVARMAYEEGKFKEAKRLLFKSLHRARELEQRQFAEAATLMGIGAVCLAMKNFKEARDNLEKAIALARTQDTEAMQLVYGIAIRFLADVLAELDELDRAESLLLESAKVLENIGEDAALFLADTVSDLGALYVMLERYKEAEEYIDSAIAIYRCVKGVEDIDYYRAMTIHKIASHEVKEEEDMENLVEATLTRSAYQVSLQHPHLTRFLNRYVNYLSKKGETEKIEHLHKKFNKAFV